MPNKTKSCYANIFPKPSPHLNVYVFILQVIVREIYVLCNIFVIWNQYLHIKAVYASTC